ncbi:MAG: TetR family transcriptional regulator [Candidatus Dadabacteria bacterium]|nr:TetR family transcriptional regulator [Candidatus Dadabacteria bacterium]NIT14466.1 TetR family transcriptional regulator [Candidatus Dadabacteria bacterium]
MAKATRKSVAIKNKTVKKPNKKEDIIKAAAKLFSEKSFHDVKMDEIAEELGIAKGTIYLYFRSKEKLYLEILEESYEAIEALLEKEIAIDEPSTIKLKKVLGIIFSFYRRNLDVLKILSRDETHLIKEHFEFTEHWRLRRLKLYEKILEKGIKEGSFSIQNPKLTALIIFGLVRSVMFFYSSEKNTSHIAEEVFNVITNGILNSKLTKYVEDLKVINK